MKKKNLLLITLLGTILCSCGGAKENFNLRDWDSKLIDQNLIKDDESFSFSYDGYATVSLPTDVTVYDSSYESKGLIVTKNTENKIGFYSLIYDNYIVQPLDLGITPNYYVQLNTYVGYILRIKYNNLYYCYDALGNNIYSKNVSASSVYVGKTEKNNKDVIYCQITDSLDTYKYYYNSDGILDTNNVFEQNDQVGNKYSDSVSDYLGIEIDGYKFSVSDSMITVFDEEGNFKNSYSIPYMIDMSKNYFFANESFICQIAQPVADDCEEYDFMGILNNSSTLQKYVINSYKMNILTGKYKEINLDYIITTNGTIIKDKKGKSKYSLISAIIIGKDKLIKNGGEYIVNDKGKIIENATNFAVTSFIKLNNGNYYNTSTKILYDKKLNVISSFNSLSPTYFRGIGFIANKAGKYGIINEDGIIALPFTYDNIYKASYNNKLLISKDSKIYELDLYTYTTQELTDVSSIQYYGDGLFKITKGNYNIISCGNISLFGTSASTFPTYLSSFNFEFGKYHFFKDNEGKYLIFSSKLALNKNSFKSNIISEQ